MENYEQSLPYNCEVRGYCTPGKEIPVNKVGDEKRIIGKNRAEVKEGHSGSPTRKRYGTKIFQNYLLWSKNQQTGGR
jgi:hypothetical protein